MVIWYRTIQMVREETHCCHNMGYSFHLAARDLLYAPFYSQHWLEWEIAQWVHHHTMGHSFNIYFNIQFVNNEWEIFGIWQYSYLKCLIFGIWQYSYLKCLIFNIWQYSYLKCLIFGIWQYSYLKCQIFGIWQYSYLKCLIFGIWQYSSFKHRVNCCLQTEDSQVISHTSNPLPLSHLPLYKEWMTLHKEWMTLHKELMTLHKEWMTLHKE